MTEFFKAFSNREIAIIIWLIVFLVFGIYKAPKQIFKVLKAIFSKTFIPFYFIFLTYSALIIWLLNKMMIWDNALYKDFLFWFFTSAAVSFYKSNNVNNWAKLNIMVFQVFSWNIIIEFIINAYNFTLGFEIVFIAILAFITLLFTFALAYNERPGYVSVAKFLNSILSAFGFALIIYVISQIITNYDKILNLSSLKSFLFAPIFTLLFSPFIIFTVFYIKYENIFLSLNRYQFISNAKKTRIKFAIIKNAKLNFKYIKNAHDILLWRKRELQENENIENYLKKAVKEEVNKNNYEF